MMDHQKMWAKIEWPCNCKHMQIILVVIPQCTLPPQPMCQTLLSDFSRVWLRDYHKADTWSWMSCVSWLSRYLFLGPYCSWVDTSSKHAWHVTKNWNYMCTANTCFASEVKECLSSPCLLHFELDQWMVFLSRCANRGSLKCEIWINYIAT